MSHEIPEVHAIVSLSKETQETILSVVKQAQANADAATELAVQATVFAQQAHADNLTATIVIGLGMICTALYAAWKK